MLNGLGVDYDNHGNVNANTDDYATSIDKVFAAGDMRRGQSLVVWAIQEAVSVQEPSTNTSWDPPTSPMKI